MNQRRKLQLPLRSSKEFNPSSVEIVEAPGKRTRVPGTPVELVSAGPTLEIVEAPPREPKANLADTGGISLRDIETVKGLVGRVKSNDLKELIELLSG
jgi:hypothetical protein